MHKWYKSISQSVNKNEYEEPELKNGLIYIVLVIVQFYYD